MPKPVTHTLTSHARLPRIQTHGYKWQLHQITLSQSMGIWHLCGKSLSYMECTYTCTI